MKTPENFNLLIAPETIHVAGSAWVKHVIAISFIALMALCFTSPAEAPSTFDKPLPMPAELGLDNSLLQY